MIIPYALAAFGAGAYVQLNRPLNLDTPATVDIRTGESFDEILAGLQQRKLFASHWQVRYLKLWARVTRSARDIRAGEFRIKPGTTPLTLLTLLSSDNVVLHQLTLIDGWRFSQAWAAIKNDPNLRHTLGADVTSKQIMVAIGHPRQAAEGRFFPDTYSYPRGETDVAFLRNAYAAMVRHLKQTWASRAADLPFNTAYDALIMASLIEKETAQPAERTRISGVFARRLRIGMKLQTDPSVIYGMGNRYKGNITRKDLKTDTPYNTYTRYGLPPTPICLPGQAALTAAVHPAAGKALYFVSKGNGTHVFSDTLAEHNAAVRRYQLHRR